MGDNNKDNLEDRARKFLCSAAIGRTGFSEAFHNADADIKRYLLKEGYVAEERITALGRTYAEYHNREITSS